MQKIMHTTVDDLASNQMRISQVRDELSTAYVFKGPLKLLHQALMYPSVKMQRLAFLGPYILEALVVKNVLAQKPGSTGTMRQFIDSLDSTIKQETADPSLKADLDNLPRNTKTDARLDETVQYSSVSKYIDACCSHTACAVTAVRLKLDQYLLHQGSWVSSDFHKEVKQFARTARIKILDQQQPAQGKEKKKRWQYVASKSPPRPLRDAFCAVLSAIVLDQGSLDAARPVVEQHMEGCVSIDSEDSEEDCEGNDTMEELSEEEQEIEAEMLPTSQKVECKVCSSVIGKAYYLNGPKQYNEHIDGKNHKKKKRKMCMGVRH